MCSFDCHCNTTSSLLKGWAKARHVVARPGNTRLGKLDTETKVIDRNDLGNLDIWHPSESLTPGCNGVGWWGGLQLSTCSQAVQVAKEY